jgi:hypothetical protein
MGKKEYTNNEILAFIILTLTILSIPVLIGITVGLLFLSITSLLQYFDSGIQGNIFDLMLYPVLFLISFLITRKLVNWIRK